MAVLGRRSARTGEWRLMRIEVAYAGPERQALVAFDLDEGASLAAALRAAACHEAFAGLDVEAMPTGIYGAPARRSQALREGDRVELYRPLALDPKEARRRRAQAGV